MAEKRMFAKSIIDSDDFIDMPVTSRLLYYDLSMRADDDGFVNAPKKIMRFIGASQDDLKVLASKGFIIPFESGIVVIKHWRIHNYIRKDMYHETKYKAEKSLLEVDENNEYVLPVTTSLQVRNEVVTNPSTQIRLDKISIDKTSIDKDREDKTSIDKNTIVRESERRFDVFWDAYPRKASKKDAKKSWNRINPSDELLEVMLGAINEWKRTEQWSDERYIPLPSTWLNQERWNDEVPKKKDHINNLPRREQERANALSDLERRYREALAREEQENEKN